MTKKTTFPSDTADKFMLRMPNGLRDTIKEAAENNGRSMNSEIVRRLENSLLNREPSSLDQIATSFDVGLMKRSLTLKDDDREKLVKAYLEAKEAEIKRIREFIDLANELSAKAVSRLRHNDTDTDGR